MAGRESRIKADGHLNFNRGNIFVEANAHIWGVPSVLVMHQEAAREARFTRGVIVKQTRPGSCPTLNARTDGLTPL